MPVVPCPDCQRDVSTLAPACPHCGRPSPAGGAPISEAPPAAPQLPAVEETLWRGTPAWTLLIGHLLGMLITLIVVPIVTVAIADQAADLNSMANARNAGFTLTVILLLVQAVIFGVALLQLRSTLYTVTNQRVIIETGLISKALSEIDLRYINDSQFSQGIIHRILGIGNVTILSSDKTTPVFVMRSIKDPRGVRELIRAHAYQVSHRQLLTRAT